VHRNIFEYVLAQAISRPSGALSGKGQVAKVEATDVVVWNEDVDKTIDIDFPPIISDDTAQKVAAIVDAATLKGQQRAATFTDKTLAKMLLNALGEHEIDEEITKLFGDGEDLLKPPPARGPALPQQAPTVPTAESMVIEAVCELREAIAQAMKETV
jgi:hypothetical protein